MRRRPLHAPHPFGEVNVTPMIDVVMCMIVFYLIVGRLVTGQRTDLRLPSASTGSSETVRDLLVINIVPIPGRGTSAGGGGRVLFEGAEVPPGEPLTTLIREHVKLKPTASVLIRASRELKYGDVAPVLASIREAGVTSLRLATEKATEKAP